jgi:hypothetical protein
MTAATNTLHDLFLTLKRKEIYIEADPLTFQGELVYVGKRDNSSHAFMTIKDVLHGNTRVPFKNITQVWYRNRILWHQAKQVKKSVNKRPAP